MSSKIFTLKNRVLSSLPEYIAKIAFGINHKDEVYKENLPNGESFEIIIPHTMLYSYGNGHENGVLKKIQEVYADKNMVFFDVGACFGYYSMLIESIANAKIYTFEPFVGHFMYLEKNTKKYSKDDKHWVITKKLVGVKNNNKMISLDLFCKKNKVYPNLIKIDVDGAELDVLEGCKEIIKKKKTNFLIEFDGKDIKNWNIPFINYIEQTFGENYEIEYLKDVHINSQKWEKDLSLIKEEELMNDIYIHARINNNK